MIFKWKIIKSAIPLPNSVVRKIMKKIKVKDYYAIKRANARAKKLSEERRKEIARKAIEVRWNNYEETKNV